VDHPEYNNIFSCKKLIFRSVSKMLTHHNFFFFYRRIVFRSISWDFLFILLLSAVRRHIQSHKTAPTLKEWRKYVWHTSKIRRFVGRYWLQQIGSAYNRGAKKIGPSDLSKLCKSYISYEGDRELGEKMYYVCNDWTV